LLRQSVADATIQVPGAFNALTARLIEQSGFDAVYLSGAAFSAGALALPDVGLFTLSELTAETARLARSVKIPLIVDADTGFGEAINVERTVRIGRRGGDPDRRPAFAETLRSPLGKVARRIG
jgi:2-methylisocitrate lyase-like PEP mutase family enzyme